MVGDPQDLTLDLGGFSYLPRFSDISWTIGFIFVRFRPIQNSPEILKTFGFCGRKLSRVEVENIESKTGFGRFERLGMVGDPQDLTLDLGGFCYLPRCSDIS